MTDRSAQLEVRNPILALPSMSKIAGLSPEAKSALMHVLADIRTDAILKAEKSWRQNKGPMAAYWKAVSVYALHIGRAIKRVESSS